MRWIRSIVMAHVLVLTGCATGIEKEERARLTALERRDAEWEQVGDRVVARLESNKRQIAALQETNAALLAELDRVRMASADADAKCEAMRTSCVSVVEENESLRVLAAKRCGSEL